MMFKRKSNLKENGKSYCERYVRLKSGQQKTIHEQIDMLGLEETADEFAKAKGVRWY